VTASLEVMVAGGGELGRPSGLALRNGLVFVTDHADGRILVFDAAGQVVNWLDTGLGGDALGAIAFSKAGKAFVLDMAGGRLLRIEPK
jgi:hypothetical protein